MKKKLIIIAIAFLLVRGFTVYFYNVKLKTYYYYGMVSGQFLIAEAAYKGHWLSWNEEISGRVFEKANSTGRFVPIEEYKDLDNSGRYRKFQTTDLPGYGYLIAITSKYFSSELTSKYAFAIQILMELISLLFFVYCVGLVLGEKVSFIAGLLYVFLYHFSWPAASQPMRDVFLMPILAFYVAAFFFFARARELRQYVLPVFLIFAASCLLWVRPSGYYLFVLASPLILFMKDKKPAARFAIIALTLVIPYVIFGITYKNYNLRNYGRENIHLLGRGAWEGMGIIEDNLYGFVLDDGALVPWCKEQGHDVTYGSPEMNKILGDYAVEIIKRDPVYYLKTVAKRVAIIALHPLTNVLPGDYHREGQYGIRLKRYLRNPRLIIKYPKGFSVVAYENLFGVLFFYASVILAIVMFFRLKEKRLELIVLLSPVFYSLASQIPMHFEPRYFAMGAWPMVFPIAWFIQQLIERRKPSPSNSDDT